MGASFSTDGGKTTLTIEATADTAVMQDIVDNFVHKLWDGRYEAIFNEGRDPELTWDELTNTHKLAIFMQNLKDRVIGVSRRYKTEVAEKAAAEDLAAALALMTFDEE